MRVLNFVTSAIMLINIRVCYDSVLLIKGGIQGLKGDKKEDPAFSLPILQGLQYDFNLDYPTRERIKVFAPKRINEICQNIVNPVSLLYNKLAKKPIAYIYLFREYYILRFFL